MTPLRKTQWGPSAGLDLGRSFWITSSAINTMMPIPMPIPYSRKATRSCSSRRGAWIFWSDWKRPNCKIVQTSTVFCMCFLIIRTYLCKWVFHRYVNNLAFPCLSEPMCNILTQVGARRFFVFQFYYKVQHLAPISHDFSSPLCLSVQVHPTTWVHCQSLQRVNSLF